MTSPDTINGAFETLGGLAQLANCRRLYVDKAVAGVAWWGVALFAAWGWWNLFYYPHLGQWMSFSGGVVIVAANSLWVGMALYYGAHKCPS